MFIRKVPHTDPKNGSRYYTYKLVESFRTERGPRQREILNLGTDFNLPEGQWRDLARRVPEIISGQERLFDCPEEIETLARVYARRIIRRRSSLVGEKNDSYHLPDYQMVDVNSIGDEDVREVGAEHVVYETIRELELNRKFEELGFSKPRMDVAIGVIAGRLIYPGSERATHLWLKHISGIDELLGADFSTLSQDQVYKAADMLIRYKRAVEEHLSVKERSLFTLKEKIVLYDLTNTFFEGSGRYNDKARFGWSKEKRNDCPLVTLGLVLDDGGFPKRSQMFEGNVSEPKTMQRMIQGLSSNTMFKPVVVMDAGIATGENIRWLKDHQYDYLVVLRGKKKPLPENMVTVKEDGDRIVKAALVRHDETGEVELVYHSTGKQEKERGLRNLFQQRFEFELQKLQAALSRKNGTKRYEKVIEKIGRLKEKFKMIAHRYDIAMEKDEKNRVTAITWHQKETEDTDGIYWIRTNREDFREQQIWNIFNMLTDVEDAFRCMKSELGLRPVHHQREHRVDGHLFITVLAYHILHTIRFKLRQKGIHDSWKTLREGLSTHVRVTTLLKRQDGRVIYIRKSSRPEAYHKKIYDALNLSYQVGRRIKTIV
ncbi:MAG: IS1634 family transposase [Syntrophales bacterium]|nr:IS1634 family transposase [Syntrophales bacterium]